LANKVHCAAPLSVYFQLILLLGLAVQPCCMAQMSSATPGSQAEINKQVQEAYQAAQAAAAKKDFVAAESQLEKVVHLAPQLQEGHSALGAILLQLGKFPEAIKELEQALELKPSDVSAETSLAWAYEQTGAYKKSIVLFQKVETEARAKPASDPAHKLSASFLAAYARALAATGQVPAAITKMKVAVAESPQSPDLHDALGTLHAQQSDWPVAVGEFQKAIELNRQFAAAHLHLGAALLAQQQAEPAIQELALACQFAPDSAAAVTELGKAYAANKEDAKAITEFQHAIKLDPNSMDAKYQLALAFASGGNQADALPLLRQVVQAQPKNAEAAASLGLALLLAENAKDAIPFLEHALKQKPGDPVAYENLAAAYLQMNAVDEAIGLLRSGLTRSPENYQLHYNLGLALKLKDDNAAAIPELETASKLNPSAHEPHYTLGVLFMQDGRYDDAARELTAAMKLHPDNADGWATLGGLYVKMNKLPEAGDALREAIRRMPDQPDPHLLLASVLSQQGDATAAAAERKKGADLERVGMHRQRATVSTNSGNALLQKGQVADAIERFQQALSEDPDYAEAHRGLARALERQGKITEAAVEREKAKQLEKPRP
jgi:protein O-GlcNAc transferase